MNKTTLQFESLAELAAFLESVALINFEINYNHFTFSCEMDPETLEKAIHHFGAVVLTENVFS